MRSTPPPLCLFLFAHTVILSSSLSQAQRAHRNCPASFLFHIDLLDHMTCQKRPKKRNFLTVHDKGKMIVEPVKSPWVLGNQWGGTAARGTSRECLSHTCSLHHCTAAVQCQGPARTPLQSGRRENTALVQPLTTLDVNTVTMDSYERRSFFVSVFECFNLFHSCVTNK